jgi:tetratricopeptide (TPR) repeat protein
MGAPAGKGDRRSGQRLKDFVFVSYAREDRGVLRARLLDHLDGAGIAYWFDEHLDWDDNWWREVRSRIHEAHAVVVLMSSHASTSDWVSRELLVAQEQNKAIFPLLLEGDPLRQLTELQFLDLRGRAGPSRQWLDSVRDRIRSARQRRLVRAYSATVLLKVVPVVAAFVLLIQVVLPLVRGPRIPRLTGDYNVAVAQFTNDVHDDLPDSVSGVVDTFVPGVVAGVRRALQQSPETDRDRALLGIEVRELPIAVSGTRPEEQPPAARNVATASNADALLFGSITNDGAAVVVTPLLWLSPRALPRAEELAGVHRLQTTREDVSRPDAAIRLRRLVASTAEDLAALTDLIRLYDAGDYDVALTALQGIRTGGFAQEGLLDVLEGNLAGKLNRFDDAAQAYQRALSHSSYAARAQLGLLQVQYSKALGDKRDCGPDVDARRLDAVITGYQRLQRDTGPPGGNIQPKALFGEARARMCLDASGHRPDNGRGRRLLQEVSDGYERAADGSADDDLRELAAEAQALIGESDGRRANGKALQAALDHLDRAQQLTTFNERRQVFILTQARLLHRAGEYNRACQKVRQARELVPSGQTLPPLAGLTCP